MKNRPINLYKLCHELPKAEVHVHLEGTFELEYMSLLAQKYNTSVPKEAENLQKQELFELDTFFEAYYGACELLREGADFEGLVERYLKRAAKEGVVYAEIAIDVQNHMARGV